MKLIVFGGTGPTGRLLVGKALAAGHSVTVYARTPSKLSLAHQRLTVVSGELSNASAIANAVAGQDAVISVLGPGPKSKGRQLTEGMASIVAAMKQGGVSRLIATSTPSSPDPADRFSFGFRLGIWLVRMLGPEIYADLRGAAQIVRSSGLECTLVRLPMLTNKEASPPPVADYVGAPGIRLFWLSRNVLADFLLSQIADRAWLGKAPVLSNRK